MEIQIDFLRREELRRGVGRACTATECVYAHIICLLLLGLHLRTVYGIIHLIGNFFPHWETKANLTYANVSKFSRPNSMRSESQMAMVFSKPQGEIDLCDISSTDFSSCPGNETR